MTSGADRIDPARSSGRQLTNPGQAIVSWEGALDRLRRCGLSSSEFGAHVQRQPSGEFGLEGEQCSAVLTAPSVTTVSNHRTIVAAVTQRTFDFGSRNAGRAQAAGTWVGAEVTLEAVCRL